jgi:hypothetical protein
MNLRRWTAGPLVLGLLLLTAGHAAAERVPSSKVPSAPPATGSRPDITVPYTTNGWSTLGVANGVSPRIYSSPNVDNKTNPDVRKVYNLQMYGGQQSFGGLSNGAVFRPWPLPLPR